MTYPLVTSRKGYLKLRWRTWSVTFVREGRKWAFTVLRGVTLGLALTLTMCSPEPVQGFSCGTLCKVYSHALSFRENLEELLVDVELDSTGAFAVYLPGEPYAVDILLDTIPAYGPVNIHPQDIVALELIEPVHSKRIEGPWGDHGVLIIHTGPALGKPRPLDE